MVPKELFSDSLTEDPILFNFLVPMQLQSSLEVREQIFPYFEEASLTAYAPQDAVQALSARLHWRWKAGKDWALRVWRVSWHLLTLLFIAAVLFGVVKREAKLIIHCSLLWKHQEALGVSYVGAYWVVRDDMWRWCHLLRTG